MVSLNEHQTLLHSSYHSITQQNIRHRKKIEKQMYTERKKKKKFKEKQGEQKYKQRGRNIQIVGA
jgi:hypothetical protein